MSSPASLSLRTAAADTDELRRLAALDSAAPLEGEALVAYTGGRAVAALSTADGRVVADPFAPTAGVVELLRVRAGQATSVARGGGRRSGRVARLALG
jgi:hypothetical protein